MITHCRTRCAMPVCLFSACALLATGTGCSLGRLTNNAGMFSVPDVAGLDDQYEPAVDEPIDEPLTETLEDKTRERRDDITRNLERGRMEARAGRLRQAARFYERVIRDDPRHGEAYHRLAVLADMRGEYLAAERHYARALEIHPGNADLLNDLGYSYLLQERYEEAEQTLRQALAAKPGHGRALANLELLYQRGGDEQRADAVADIASSMNADVPDQRTDEDTTTNEPGVRYAAMESFTDAADDTNATDSADSLPLWTTDAATSTTGVLKTDATNTSDSKATASPTMTGHVLPGHVLPGGRQFPTAVLNAGTTVELPPPRWEAE